MIDEWNDFDFAEGFFYSAGHAPVQSASLGGDNKVYWQLFWESKDASNAGWADWATNTEADAWREKHSSVMVCGGEGRRGYDVYFPLGDEANWNGPTEWVTYGHYCKYNDENGLDLLREAVGAPTASLSKSSPFSSLYLQ